MPIESAVAIVCEIVESPVVMAVLMRKTALRWQVGALKMSQVPFAANRGEIAGFLQGLRQGPLFQREAVLGPRPDDTDLQTVPHRIPAGHERSPRRRANWLDVKCFQPS